ncbi:hypothetical protein Nepgr_021714 [Nepenthes gracilis]|uniref:Uncharacterized protein n=1 Tax=Nepenthes gracilis TaxID=150966 RepID=A0AAD3XWA9_NEPGR|nr:hypothetical protein Nepgr_021714 [Nepenthes gracilis]
MHATKNSAHQLHWLWHFKGKYIGLRTLRLASKDNATQRLHRPLSANQQMAFKKCPRYQIQEKIADPIRDHEMPKRIAASSQNSKGNGQVITNLKATTKSQHR